MTNLIVTDGGHTIKEVEGLLLSKISDSANATETVAVKLAGANERLYLKKAVLNSTDATDTNNITVDFHVFESDASADGGADTTGSEAVANWVGTSYWDTDLAGTPQVVDFAGYTAPEDSDLVAVITVAAGTPTIKYVLYYALL